MTSRCTLQDQSYVNIIILSLAFSLTFCAFGTAEALETTSNGNNGAISLSILYGVFTLSNLFVPIILDFFTPKTVMIAGSTSYVLFIASNITDSTLLLFCSSIVLGIGAAMIWIAQSVFLTLNANQYERSHHLPMYSTLGYFNGIFFLFKRSSTFFGYLELSILTECDISAVSMSSYESIYILLSIIAGCGVITFFGLKSESRIRMPKLIEMTEVTEETEETAVAPTKWMIIIGNLRSAVSLWKDHRLQLICPLIIYSGTIHVFQYGYFPTLITTKEWRFRCLAIFGFCDAVSSLVMGQISDRIGRLPILMGGAMFNGVIFVFLWTHFEFEEFNAMTGHFELCILSGCLGIGNGCIGPQIYALLPVLFEDVSKADVFANAKFFREISSSIAFGLYTATGDAYQTMSNLFVLVVAIVCVVSSQSIRRVAQ